MKNKIFIIIFVFCFLLIGKNVFASDNIDIDFTFYGGACRSYNPGNYSYITYNSYPVVQSFKPSQNNLSKITFKNSWGQAKTILLYLCKGTFSQATPDYYCATSTFIASTSLTMLAGDQFTTINFSPILTMEQGQQYYFSLGSNDGGAGYIRYTTTTSSDNNFRADINTTGTYGQYNIHYPICGATYYDSSNITLSFVPYVENVGGMDSGGIYKNFDFFQMDFSSSATTSSLTLNTNYYKTTSPNTSYTDIMSLNSFVGVGTVRLSVPKTQYLDNGSWTVRAYILDDNASIVKDTSMQFYIDNTNGSSTFVFNPMTDYDDYTYQHICDDIATSTGTYFDDFRYGIECGFKKILYWSFYPSQNSLNGLSTSYYDLKQTFPFSAYYGLTDTITNSISTSTATNGTLKMPFIDKTGHYTMLTVMSSSSLPNMIGGTNANLFRNSLSWIIWALTAFVIFITFKKI